MYHLQNNLLCQKNYESFTGDWKCGTIRLLEAISPKESKYDFGVYRFLIETDAVATIAKRHVPKIQSEIEQKFLQLAAQWQKETSVMSSISMKSMHPSYQRIIGMGHNVVPLILRELKRKPGHWFWALTAITGEDPISPDDAGDIEKMTKTWLEFGKRQGYFEDE